MRLHGLVFLLLAGTGAAHAQGVDSRPASAALPPARFEIGATVLPILRGKVVIGPAGNGTPADLGLAYGFGLSFGYRLGAGLSVGVAPQVLLHLGAKDSGGYVLIESEKEYDLLARIAYTHPLTPKLAVHAEVLPGFSFVTYSQIVFGQHPPSAKGLVFGGGLGATYRLTDPFFATASLGYQRGFQQSSGIVDKDLKTSLLRVALGGGLRF